jgi:peptidoglycan/LPS O-acetylase OafA/YrhL
MESTVAPVETPELAHPANGKEAAPRRRGSESGASPIRGYIRELDGLRGVAILLVMLYHWWPETGPLARFAGLPTKGWVGVDLFFVISGFLITGILLDTVGERGYYRNFYARRALRILPLYYLFLAGVLLGGGRYADPAFRHGSGSPLWHLFYLGNIHTAISGRAPYWLLGPLWSLSIEEQYYILFPWIVAALRREQLKLFLWSLVVAAPLFRLLTSLHDPANWLMQYVATPARVDVLAFGCLLALELRSGRLAPRRKLAGMALVVLGAVLIVVIRTVGLDPRAAFCRVWGYSVVGLACACLVLWTVWNREQRCTAWLRAVPLCHLGKLCYGLYLLQLPAEAAVLTLSAKLGISWHPDSTLLLIAKFATTLLFAQVSWVLFERNLLRLKRRFDSMRHPARETGSIRLANGASAGITQRVEEEPSPTIVT